MLAAAKSARQSENNPFSKVVMEAARRHLQFFTEWQDSNQCSDIH